MFVPAEVPFYIYSFEGYLPDLQAKIDGKSVPVLPHTEISRITGVQVDTATIRAIVAESMNIDPADLADHNTFAVVKFPPNTQGHLELIFSWIEKIDNDREIHGLLTKSASIAPRFSHIPGASLYVDLMTTEKYQISNKPILRRSSLEPLKEGVNYTTILSDNRHYAFRLGREANYDIVIECSLAIPPQVSSWAVLGLALGTGVIIFAVFFHQLAGFTYVAGLAGGTLAILFGLRVVILHDIELLKNWHPVYIALIILIAATVATIAVVTGMTPKP